MLLLKEKLISAEIQLKRSERDMEDYKLELERSNKSVHKKDNLIKQLNYEVDKLKQVQVWEELHDSGLLGENFHYEERVKMLEQEVEELKIENENYANNEIVRLENTLQTQKERTIKSRKEKDYFEERCAILEQQNKELKNRVDSLKQGML